MMYEVYTIYDKLSGEYADLRCFKNEDLAKRYFESVCKDCKFANDLQLFKVGVYDTEQGLLGENGVLKPYFVMGGVENE